MIYYFVSAKQTYAMKSFLESWGKPLAGSIEIVTYEAFLAGRQRVPERGGVYIFNSLAMLRRASPEVRSAIHGLHDRLVDACGPAKVLNNPKTALSRFDLLRALHDRGTNSFNVYRLNETPGRFPVFIRQESETEFSQPPLCRNADEYAAAVRGAQWTQGSLADMVALEFCDTADANGIYRKYGAFVVGDRIVPRHLFFSRNWMVKLADLAEPSMIEEELAFLDSNQHADLVAGMRAPRQHFLWPHRLRFARRPPADMGDQCQSHAGKQHQRHDPAAASRAFEVRGEDFESIRSA